MDQPESITQKGIFAGVVTAHEAFSSGGAVYLCIGISETGHTSVARSWEAFFPPGTAVMALDDAMRPRLVIDNGPASEGPNS